MQWSTWLEWPSHKYMVSLLPQMAPLLLIFCLLLCYVSFRFRRRRMEALAAKISGPPAWPLVGNALELLGSTHGKARRLPRAPRAPCGVSVLCSHPPPLLPPDVLVTISRLLHRYGTPFAFWLGPHLYVAVARPADIEVRHAASVILVCQQHLLTVHARPLSLGCADEPTRPGEGSCLPLHAALVGTRYLHRSR